MAGADREMRNRIAGGLDTLLNGIAALPAGRADAGTWPGICGTRIVHNGPERR